jgi:hypothetical protein
MAGLVPAIHDLTASAKEFADTRHKAGHDENARSGKRMLWRVRQRWRAMIRAWMLS